MHPRRVEELTSKCPAAQGRVVTEENGVLIE
jgi:hypothetical protein